MLKIEDIIILVAMGMMFCFVAWLLFYHPKGP